VVKELTDRVAEVRRKINRIMSTKLVLGAEVLNVICVYVPQMGLSEDIKNVFLGGVGRSIAECTST